MRVSFWGILIAIFVAIFPFLPWLGLMSGGVVAKYFFLIALTEIVILGGVYYLYTKQPAKLFFRRPLIATGLLVLLTQIIAAGMGVFFEHSLLGDSARMTGVFFLTHILLFACIVGELLRVDDWRIILRAVSVSAGAMALLTIIGHEGFGYNGSILWLNLEARDPFFGNETFLGMYLVLAGVISVIELIKTNKVWWRLIILSSLVLTTFSPILFNFSILLGSTDLLTLINNPQVLLGHTRTSGAVFFAFLAFILGWWSVTKIRQGTLQKYIKIALVVTTIALSVLGPVLLLTPGSIVQSALLAEKTSGQRFVVWEESVKAIGERPFFGWGPENFDRAFEAHFNPHLYEITDRIEAWFDRAHNVLLDTLVSVGFVGFFATLCLAGAYVLTMYQARQRGDITEGELMLWIAIPVVHVLQLQTSFDVIPTYVLLGVVGGYAFWLEANGVSLSKIGRIRRYLLASVLVGVAIVGSALTFMGELPRQQALVASLSELSPQVREGLINYALSRPSDFEGLHRSGNLFIESVLTAVEGSPRQDQMLSYARGHLSQYIAAYERYLVIEPEHYRARINYVYLLLLMQQWGGEQRTEEALQIIGESYELSPRNPMTYVLHIMTYAYAGDTQGARSVLAELKEFAPSIQLALDVEKWLANQEIIFPRHSFLRISNI